MLGIIIVFTSFFLSAGAYGQGTCVDESTQDAINWVKELIKKDSNLINRVDTSFLKTPNNDVLSQQKCRTNAENLMDRSFKVYAFLSFSVPQETWLELSNDLKKINGVVVLRGIPNNSFVELSKRIQDLDKKGFSIPLQINPLLFEKFAITQVPSYVVVDGDKFDKVTGNVSIKFALDLMTSQGETEEVKHLAFKLRGNES